jgi:beta-N-acetylhexosaminidase
MTAHVRYPLVDDQIATFSHYWLRKCLQKELHFNGIIFSDDLMMKSTDFITSTPKKALLSFAAGCDFVLICNSLETVNQCLSELDYAKDKFANLERKIQYLIPFHQGQRQAKYLQEIKTKLNRLLDSLK